MPETVLERMEGQLDCSIDETSYKMDAEDRASTQGLKGGVCLVLFLKMGLVRHDLSWGHGLAAGDTVDNCRCATPLDKRDET